MKRRFASAIIMLLLHAAALSCAVPIPAPTPTPQPASTVQVDPAPATHTTDPMADPLPEVVAATQKPPRHPGETGTQPPPEPATSEAANPPPTWLTTRTPGPADQPPTSLSPRTPEPGTLLVAYAEHRADGGSQTIALPTGTAVALTAFQVLDDGTLQPVSNGQGTWTTTEPERFLIDHHGTLLAPHQATGDLTVRHAGLTQTVSISAEGPPYRTVHHVTRLILLPENTVLNGPGTQTRLRIRAAYSDGGTGPLPQNLDHQPRFHANPPGPATVAPSGTVTAVEPGTVEVTATLAHHSTAEPALVHVVPPPQNSHQELTCATTAQDPDTNGSFQVHANAFTVELRPAQDSQDQAESLAESLEGEVAYHVPSQGAYVLHMPCPGETPDQISQGLHLLWQDLLGRPAVQHAAPLPVQRPFRTERPQEPASNAPAPPGPTGLPRPQPRTGDSIINIDTAPPAIRLTPGQMGRIEYIDALMTSGSTAFIMPGDPELKYSVQSLTRDDGHANPENTLEILLNTDGTFGPVPRARTASYHLVVEYRGHRTRIRIDVRGTHLPLQNHPGHCNAANGFRGQLMLEFLPGHAGSSAPQVASALGAEITASHDQFGGRVLTIPCSGAFAMRAALKSAEEFPTVAHAYIHVPTPGDAGPTMTEPVLPIQDTFLTLRTSTSHTLTINTAAYDDGTTGPMPREELAHIRLRSQDPAIASVYGHSITANSPGSTTVELLHRGKIATTVSVRVEQ